jgi:hypothetical protein
MSMALEQVPSILSGPHLVPSQAGQGFLNPFEVTCLIFSPSTRTLKLLRGMKEYAEAQ